MCRCTAAPGRSLPCWGWMPAFPPGWCLTGWGSSTSTGWREFRPSAVRPVCCFFTLGEADSPLGQGRCRTGGPRGGSSRTSPASSGGPCSRGAGGRAAFGGCPRRGGSASAIRLIKAPSHSGRALFCDVLLLARMARGPAEAIRGVKSLHSMVFGGIMGPVFP